ncbi:MAG TPA: thiol:disulfide interchange protein DsbA/DsbL [Thiotrichaceae bacterium]|jgi:thiol:disulfide interchange protein DsbA|nr:thiol:disulfide interchange protein DsbA/DsbL [Thiotrichaceae bacterium]HIM09080.1 thiol:disulfide interchange protein DsbA/DsbL [Gammaproteobacteria bacterium]
MKKIIRYISLSLLLMLGGQAYAEDGYNVISPAQPTQTGDKIEVLEIFWYACPHCYDFEPYVNEWLENVPEDVTFRRMPGIFRKSWIPHAKAFYTAEKMGILDKIHTPLFHAIHRDKKKLFDDKSIKKFFLKQGVDKAEFTKIYESDEIDTKAKQAYVMGSRYKVTGVPAVIVNGKYMVSGSTAGSFENVLKVVDSLVDKERASTASE